METLSTKTLIANQSPTAILNCAHNRAKLEYRKTHSDTLLTQAVTRIKLQRPCDTFPTFQLECFPFTDQTFVSSRLQICTSWSSPISTITSTFVLVCCFGPDFQTSTFACYKICPFRLQLLQRSLLLSTLNHSRFNVSVSFNFRRSRLSLRLSFPWDISSFPFDFTSLSGFSSRSAYSASHLFVQCFFFNFLFVSSSIRFRRNQNPDVAIHVPTTSMK